MEGWRMGGWKDESMEDGVEGRRMRGWRGERWKDKGVEGWKDGG